ncbi:unnamed protein product [Prunus armeniaca]
MGQIETAIHALHDCTAVWDTLPSSQHSLFTITLWFLWNARNAAFFGSPILPPELIVLSVKNYDAKYQKVLVIHHRRSSLPIPAKKWQTPPGHFKLNVDGALSLNSGLRGVGVVVRNSYGRLCGAVAMRAPSLLSILATDLYAPKIGISFVMDASITPLIIESDSSNAIHMILQENPCYAVEGALVEEIRWLLDLLPSYSACVVPRTANEVADLLMRFSLGQEDLTFWFSDPPLWLQDCLIEDSPDYTDVCFSCTLGVCDTPYYGVLF